MTSLSLLSSITHSLDCKKHVARACAGVAMLAFGCLPAAAQTLKPGDLAPFEVVFEVGNNLITAGTATLLLEKKEDTWRYSLTTKPRGVFKLAGKGNISEVSTFNTVETEDQLELQPQTYQFRQDKERRRAVDATFDWETKIINHVYRGNEVKDTFTDPVLDRLTVTLLIMNSLRNDFERTELPIFDTGRIKAVEFVASGSESLKTPLGNIETLKVMNRNASGGSRETTTWFAPALNYLPIKIEHRKRGELVARLSLIRLKNEESDIELGKEAPEND